MPYNLSSERTKRRIPNKVQWALMDIVAECQGAREHWENGMRRAEKMMDPLMLLHLARIRDALSQVELKAAQALNGEYEQGNGK